MAVSARYVVRETGINLRRNLVMTLAAVLSFIQGVASGAIRSGTSIFYAALGEVIVQRAGIVNLGLEGCMLVGACAVSSESATSRSPAIRPASCSYGSRTSISWISPRSSSSKTSWGV